MPSFNNETGVFFFDEEEGELVDLEICQNFSRQVEPVGMEECNTEIPCPVRYLPGDYGEVTPLACGTGNRELFGTSRTIERLSSRG